MLPAEKRVGLYQNKAIGQFLNIALFNKKNALGITQAAHFGTVMPQATVAYALTMVNLLYYPRHLNSSNFLSPAGVRDI